MQTGSAGMGRGRGEIKRFQFGIAEAFAFQEGFHMFKDNHQSVSALLPLTAIELCCAAGDPNMHSPFHLNMNKTVVV